MDLNKFFYQLDAAGVDSGIQRDPVVLPFLSVRVDEFWELDELALKLNNLAISLILDHYFHDCFYNYRIPQNEKASELS